MDAVPAVPADDAARAQGPATGGPRAEVPATDHGPSIGVPSIPIAARPASAPRPVPSLADGPPALSGRFPADVAARLRSYVYLLVDPRSGEAFYVGPGRKQRCFRHVAAARPGASEEDRLRFAGLDRIRQIEDAGLSVGVEILRYDLGRDRAEEVAAAVHEALGLVGPAARDGQRRPATELAARLALPAEFKRSHAVVLLRLGGPDAETTYERARRGWGLSRRWTDLSSPRAPRWAVTVAGDLVAAVYRIDAWEPVPASPGALGPDASAPDRFSFTGSPDADLEARYVGRSVTGYLGPGGRGQIAYVGSGPRWPGPLGGPGPR